MSDQDLSSGAFWADISCIDLLAQFSRNRSVAHAQRDTHTRASTGQRKTLLQIPQTSPKETSLCLMCACLWMNVLKCLELKCTRRAGSQAQIKPSPTIKRISREKDQSSCDVTWSHLNDLRTVLKINYLLVIWIICLLSVWLLICMRKQKCLLGKWIIISLKEF